LFDVYPAGCAALNADANRISLFKMSILEVRDC
jgi:hypothetical protein